eukprot:3966530-Pyramimonas_sp.AAC.1
MPSRTFAATCTSEPALQIFACPAWPAPARLSWSGRACRDLVNVGRLALLAARSRARLGRLGRVEVVPRLHPS